MANWFKSSYSSGKTDCVEVAWLDGGAVGVRDSKNPTGPALIFGPRRVGCVHRQRAWREFRPGSVGFGLGGHRSGRDGSFRRLGRDCGCSGRVQVFTTRAAPDPRPPVVLR
ncbi:DUF397 domain-containing protein [Nocardia wallacei]|uniref:DUF397 domain-containing protein n=1 Tax=Nocardia wallacei TaxID=480035 RepID=UPI003CC80771